MAFKVTWLGHGSFHCEINGHSVLIDPFLTGNPAASAKPTDFDKVDYILVSHGHGDHVGDTVEIARRTAATVVSNFEIANWMQKQGVGKAHGQHIGGGHIFPFGYVKLTIAHHGSALPDGSYGGSPCGFLITSPDQERVYFACDTALFYEMQFYGNEGVDLAFVPIGDNFTMGPDDALKAVDLINPKVVVPVHYDTFDLIAQDGEAWGKQVEHRGSTKALILKPGESYTVGA